MLAILSPVRQNAMKADDAPFRHTLSHLSVLHFVAI